MNASVQKEESMVMQKKMIGEHFETLARAPESGRKVTV